MEIMIRPWRMEDLPAVRRILWESWMAAYSAFVPEGDLRAYHEATYPLGSLTRMYGPPLSTALSAKRTGRLRVSPGRSFT